MRWPSISVVNCGNPLSRASAAAPVVAGPPVVGELREVVQRDAAGPAHVGQLARASGRWRAGRAGRRGRPAGSRCGTGGSRRCSSRSPVSGGLVLHATNLGTIAEGTVPRWRTGSTDARDAPPGCCGCSSLLQSRRHWTGAELAEPARRHHPHDPQRRRAAARRSATRSRPGPASPAATGSAPAAPCRRCCSTTRRRSRSRSVCAPPRAARSPASRSRRCGRWPSSSRSCPSRLRHRVDALQSDTLAMASTRPPGRPGRADRRSRPRAATTSGCASDYRSPVRRRTPGARSSPTAWSTAGGAGTSLAWDLDRDDWRTFRVDRMELRTPNGPASRPRAAATRRASSPSRSPAASARPPGATAPG